METEKEKQSPLLDRAAINEADTFDEPTNDNFQAIRDPAPVLTTNRRKAIIFINLFCIFQFAYYTLVKVMMNRQEINALDICLVRTLFMLFASLTVAKSMGASLYIQPEDRWLLAFRGAVGTTGFTLITYGIAMVPLTVQNTIFNTGPIWASILGWLFLKETITRFEIVALVLSFSAVVCIALSKHESEAEEDTLQGSRLLGSLLIFGTAWCYGTVSILTRKMQSINFAIMLLYYSFVAFPATCVLILIQCLITGEPWKLLSYESSQIGWLILTSFVNFAQLSASTIAMQNERSGFITMLGYLGLVYAFVGDLLIFDQQFGWLEVSGILVIISLNLALVCTKWNAKKPQPVPVEDRQEQN